MTTTTTYHQLICGGDPSCEVIRGWRYGLADYALTTICASSASEVIRHTCAIQIRLLLLLLLFVQKLSPVVVDDMLLFSLAVQFKHTNWSKNTNWSKDEQHSSCWCL